MIGIHRSLVSHRISTLRHLLPLRKVGEPLALVAACTHHWPSGRLFGAITCTICGAEAVCVACARSQGMDCSRLPQIYCARHRPLPTSQVFGLLDIAYHCMALSDALPVASWGMRDDGNWEVSSRAQEVQLIVGWNQGQDIWQVIINDARMRPIYCARGPRTALELSFAKPGAWIMYVRALTSWP